MDNYTYLMAAVGTALHAWSQVETGMSQLFYGVSSIRHLQKSDAIFDAVISFETRIAMLDAAIELEDLLSAEEKLVWSKLSSRMRKLYRKRHELAHFSLASPEDMIDGTRIAPFFTWGRHRLQSNKYLSRAQIMERAQAFIAATTAVSWFVNQMQLRTMRPESRPEPLPEPILIVRIRELLSQNPEEQLTLPES